MTYLITAESNADLSLTRLSMGTYEDSAAGYREASNDLREPGSTARFRTVARVHEDGTTEAVHYWDR